MSWGIYACDLIYIFIYYVHTHLQLTRVNRRQIHLHTQERCVISSCWSFYPWPGPAACCGASSGVAAMTTHGWTCAAFSAAAAAAGRPMSTRSTPGSWTRTRTRPSANRRRPQSPRTLGLRNHAHPTAAVCTWCTFSVCTRCSARTGNFPAQQPQLCSAGPRPADPQLGDLL